MSARMIKNAPVGKKFPSLRVLLEGNHTLKQKAAMFLEVKYLLQHEYNIHHAGLIHIYMPLVDQWGHPLTHFADGDEIAGNRIEVSNPYHAAADYYDSADFSSRSHSPRPSHHLLPG